MRFALFTLCALAGCGVNALPTAQDLTTNDAQIARGVDATTSTLSERDLGLIDAATLDSALDSALAHVDLADPFDLLPQVQIPCGAILCYLTHAFPRCVTDQCEIAACFPGWGDCDDQPGDGCETALNQPQTCGGCAPINNCLTQIKVCVNGTCQ